MGFKEAFTRGQDSDQNLLFDDDAFFYFAISLLSMITLPLAYSVIKPILSNILVLGENSKFKRVPMSANDQKILNQVKKQQRLQWVTKGYILKAIIFVFLLYLLAVTYSNLPEENTIKGFDPYEILEIDPTATEQQIKKAYRRITLKLHPDKNPDDPQAAQKFIMLTKAYECLTDEDKKDLCAKYGNPDGQQSLSVGIAMPSFLLKKENRAAFLAVIFIILLIVVPVIVLNALGSMGKYDENGVLMSNMEFFEKGLNENLIIRNCPKLVSQCFEFKNIQVNSRTEEEDLYRLTRDLIEEAEIRKITNFELTELLEQRKKTKQKKKGSFISKAFVLIYAHMFGKQVPESTQAQYQQVIKTIPKLVQSMVNYALQFSNKMTVERYKRMGRFFTKFMGLRCVNTLLEFSQMVVQGLWEKDPDVFQLDFFRNESSKYMKREKYPEFNEFVKQPRETRNLPNWIPAEFKQAIHDEIDMFPRLKVDYELKIDDDTVQEMTNDDFLQLNIRITRENTAEGEEIPFAHSNRYTYIKEEAWHIILSFNEEIFFYKKANDSLRVQEIAFKFIPKMVFGELTELKFNMTIKSDCYRGLDQEIPMQFSIKSINQVSRTVEYHKEDQDLEKELPFIQQMLNPQVQNANDSDDEDSSDDDDKKKSEAKQKQE